MMIETNRSEQNPFIELDEDGRPEYQLKLSLVFYLDYPPGPKRARQVYEQYMSRFGQHIRYYQSTSWLGPPWEWNAHARGQFERQGIEDLQKHSDWGYGFSDGKKTDYHLFMFHGYRPVTEPGKASFFRFEWPWNWNPDDIAAFAESVADSVPFLSGTGGYIISARPSNKYAFDRMYALCRRYWGLEAWELDLTVNFVTHGYKCPSWLTLMGDRLIGQQEHLTEQFQTLGEYAIRKSNGYVLRSRARPGFIDRNRRDPCAGENAIAAALLPFQVVEHGDFSGPHWEGRTMDWLYRFGSGKTA